MVRQCELECSLQGVSGGLRDGRVNGLLCDRRDIRGQPAIAALLAGYGIVGGLYGSQRERFAATSVDAISKVSFGVFVPIYFAIIGYRLVFGRQFSFTILLVFLVGSSLISVFSAGLAAWLGGFRGLDIINIALTTNARVVAPALCSLASLTMPGSSTQLFILAWSSRCGGHLADSGSLAALRALEGMAAALHESRRDLGNSAMLLREQRCLPVPKAKRCKLCSDSDHSAQLLLTRCGASGRASCFLFRCQLYFDASARFPWRPT